MRLRGALAGASSQIVLGLMLLQAALAVLLPVFSAVGGSQRSRAVGENRTLVRELKITDLALWSEASYCRHPSQTDLFAPFADHPAAFEHFPAGSLFPPPDSQSATRGAARVAGER